MSRQRNSTPNRGVLAPILVILVSGSLCLAVIDKENRPAYFDMVKVAVGYAFGSLRLQGSINEPDTDDADEPTPSERVDSEK